MSKFKVEAEINLESQDAEKNLENVKKEIDALEKSVKTADKSVSDWEKSFKNFGSGLKDFGKDLSKFVTLPLAGIGALAINEFIQAEKELNALNTALRNSGNFSTGAVQQFKALADELERTTNFSGGAITSASALALNYTKTAAEAEKLVRAAADLSEATGVSLDGAIKTLGSSLGGVTGQLANTIPQVRDLTEEQLRAGAAIDLVTQRFGGTAQAATQNLGGEITRLKNGFASFATEIGTQLAPFVRALVANLNRLLDFLRSLSPEVRNLALGIAVFAAALGPLAVGVGTAIKLIPVLTSGLTALLSGFKAVIAFIIGPGGFVIAIAAIGFSIAGAINLFLDLKKEAQSTGQALLLTWRFVTSQFANFVIVPILSQLQNLYSVLGRLPSVVGSAFRDSERFVGGLITSIKNEANAIDKDIAVVFEGTGKTAASSFTFGLNEVLAGFRDQIKDAFTLPVQEGLRTIETKTKATTKELSQFQRDLYQQIGTAAVSTFTNAFQSIADGSKSLKDGFSDLTQSILSDLSRIIIQQALISGLSSAFPSFFPAAGAATGGFINKGKITHRYADGGMVSGPGSGTSDSIVARVSNGEFVSDARTTSFFGPEFFVNLKRMARSGTRPSPNMGGIPAFAAGGMVQGASMGGPRIMIQNSGQPKDAKSVTTEQDAQGTVVNIILEDLQKNGSVAKSLQTNYGLKRGGV